MLDLRGLRQKLAHFVEGFVYRTDKLMPKVVGHWQWKAPPWIPWLGRKASAFRSYLNADPKRAIAFAVGVGVVGVALIWYLNLPEPHYVVYAVNAPALTTYDENGIKKIYPLQVAFTESTAPLKYVQKVVTEGISLSPAVPGSWFWTSDKELIFTPKDDWPIGTTFRVRMARRGFVDQSVHLKEYSFDFDSAPFTAKITESLFYQDPVDPNLKKLVATVQFSHPVDTAQFEQRVSLALAKDAEYLGL